MSRYRLSRETILFISIYCVSRIFLLFIPASRPDIPKFLVSIDAALTGNDLSYPGLFQLQLAVVNFLFGYNIIGIRLGLIPYEIGSIIILYKFARYIQLHEFQKPPSEASQNALIVAYVFAFFPNVIFNFSGFSEVNVTFFVIAGLYAYYREKIALSSILLGIGFLIEIYPIFFLVPILCHLLTKKNFKALFQILIVFFGIIIIGTLPFYFFNPSNFLTNYIIQFSRVPNAVSLWEVISENSTNWNFISFFNLIAISPLGLTFLIWFGVFTLFSFIYFQKFKDASKREEFLVAIAFLLLQPFVFLSLMSRYVSFGFPLICIFVHSKMKIRQFREHATNILVYCIISVSLITIILWPTLNLEKLPDVAFSNTGLYDLLQIIFFIFLALLWLRFGKKIHIGAKENEKITVIQCLNFSFILFFCQVILHSYLVLDTIIVIIGIISLIWSMKKVVSDNLLIEYYGTQIS